MQKRLDYDMMTIGRIRPLEIRMYIVVRMDDFAPLPSPFDIFVYDLIIRPLHKKRYMYVYVPSGTFQAVVGCTYSRAFKMNLKS